MDSSQEQYKYKMRLPVYVPYKYVEKRYAEIEDEKGAYKITIWETIDNRDSFEHDPIGEIRKPCCTQHKIYTHAIENNLQIKLKKFSKRYGRRTHEIAGDEHEAVDAGLTPGSENQHR